MSEDINVGAISEALNDKADRDINNLTTGGYAKGSGLGMPGNKIISMNVGASGTTYIAPANGYINFYMWGGSNKVSSIFIYYDETHTGVGSATNDGGYDTCNSIAIKRGGKFILNYGGSPSGKDLHFIYAEGEQ